MKIVSWNINSIRKREEMLLKLLSEHRPDIVCLQETKCQDAHFIHDSLQDAGYNVLCKGQKSYNGVAVLAKDPIDLITSKLDGYEHEEARFIKACVGGICIYNVYVTNGQMIGAPAYYKHLNYMKALLSDIKLEKQAGSKIVVAGDFNVAPQDSDLHKSMHHGVLCSAESRKIWFEILELGFTDRLSEYTWWDYRFKGTIGAKIDNILTSYTASTRVLKDYRFDVIGPSDHAPILSEV